MKAPAILVVFALLTAGCDKISTGNGNARAMTCSQFNGLAGTITQQDVARARATSEQFDAFKKVIAHHAGMLASVHRFSDRNRGLQLARNNDQMGWLMANSLDMTRSFCIGREHDEMKDVAIEQFDYLLVAMANPMPPNELIERDRRSTNVQDADKNEHKEEPAAIGSTADIIGKWEKWGEGEMIVRKAGSSYEVSLNLSKEGCIAQIDGTATLSGNVLNLVKNDDDQVCTITAKILGSSAHISGNNCSYYHGAACDFSGTLDKAQ